MCNAIEVERHRHADAQEVEDISHEGKNANLLCSQCTGGSDSPPVVALSIEVSNKSFGLLAKDLI